LRRSELRCSAARPGDERGLAIDGAREGARGSELSTCAVCVGGRPCTPAACTTTGHRVGLTAGRARPPGAGRLGLRDPTRAGTNRATNAAPAGLLVRAIVDRTQPSHVRPSVLTCRRPYLGVAAVGFWKLLPPSKKKCKSPFPRSQTTSILTNFIKKITNICISK